MDLPANNCSICRISRDTKRYSPGHNSFEDAQIVLLLLEPLTDEENEASAVGRTCSMLTSNWNLNLRREEHNEFQSRLDKMGSDLLLPDCYC